MHIADVSFFVGAGTPLDHGASERAFSTYVPGTVAPMLPHELADDLCSLRPNVDRLCVTVELPPSGEPQFYRSVIRSDARLTYGQAERREAPPELLDQLALNDELATMLRDRRFARGALQVQTPEEVFRFDGDGGVADAWLEGEPHAHMLVEELMILANEQVGAFLAGRQREALYRVHERPDPQAVEHLLAKLTDLGVPTPPVPEAAVAATGGDARGRDVEARRAVHRAVRPRARGVPGARAAGAQAGALRPEEPRPLRPGQRRLLPLHLADPPLSRPDRASRAPARARPRPTIRCPATCSTSPSTRSAREREAGQLEYLADDICLAWLLERRLYELGWDERFAGEITGMIGSGLFVRFAEVFEGFLPARRLHGEFFELNQLGTALAGRTTGRTYRLGDPIEVRVESIARNEGKVELGASVA